MAWLVCGCLVAVGWLLVPPRRWRTLAPPPAREVRTVGEWRGFWLPGLVLWLASMALGWAWGRGFGLVLVAALGAPLLTLAQVWRSGLAVRRANVRAAEVATACQQLAGLVRAGNVPTTALRLAARDSPVLRRAGAVLEVGGDVAQSLSAAAREPGAAGLHQLAAAWTVSERTGASLTITLDGLADRLVAERQLNRTIAAELEAARATGRILAALPLAGLALGYSFGGDPVAFLTTTAVGQVCLVTGSLLGSVGVLWSERIATAGGQ